MTPPSPAAIRALREQRALSQEGLARMLGVSVRTVARWESGLSRPSSLAVARLREAVPGQDEEPAHGR